MSKVLTAATRRGELAMAQTRVVMAALKAKHPEIEIRVAQITTEGDKDRRTALWDLKDTGFFTSRLEEALLAGEADFAVHSFKDLPTREREGLAVTAVCDRRWPEDCLLANPQRCCASGRPVGALEELPPSARVGTSSLRRAAQVRQLRPQVQLVPLRGNVRTRIRKLQTAELDAIILARAGLERLGLTKLISCTFDPRQFIPAPAQGALAIQTRADDSPAVAIVRSIDDESSRAVSLAERQVLATMKCGCHAPVGAFAECRAGTLRLYAFLSDVEGRRVIRRQAEGLVSQAIPLGEKVAVELLDAGGWEILRELEKEPGKGELQT